MANTNTTPLVNSESFKETPEVPDVNADNGNRPESESIVEREARAQEQHASEKRKNKSNRGTEEKKFKAITQSGTRFVDIVEHKVKDLLAKADKRFADPDSLPARVITGAGKGLGYLVVGAFKLTGGLLKMGGGIFKGLAAVLKNTLGIKSATEILDAEAADIESVVPDGSTAMNKEAIANTELGKEMEVATPDANSLTVEADDAALNERAVQGKAILDALVKTGLPITLSGEQIAIQLNAWDSETASRDDQKSIKNLQGLLATYTETHALSASEALSELLDSPEGLELRREELRKMGADLSLTTEQPSTQSLLDALKEHPDAIAIIDDMDQSQSEQAFQLSQYIATQESLSDLLGDAIREQQALNMIDPDIDLTPACYLHNMIVKRAFDGLNATQPEVEADHPQSEPEFTEHFAHEEPQDLIIETPECNPEQIPARRVIDNSIIGDNFVEDPFAEIASEPVIKQPAAEVKPESESDDEMSDKEIISMINDLRESDRALAPRETDPKLETVSSKPEIDGIGSQSEQVTPARTTSFRPPEF